MPYMPMCVVSEGPNGHFLWVSKSPIGQVFGVAECRAGIFPGFRNVLQVNFSGRRMP